MNPAHIGAGHTPKTALLEMRAALLTVEDPALRARAERKLDVAALVFAAAERTTADIRKYKHLNEKRIFRSKDRRPKKRLDKKAAAFQLTAGPMMSAFSIATLMAQSISKLNSIT